MITLGEAIVWLNMEPIPCACHGGPYCCILGYKEARALRDGGSIVADLFRQVITKQE